jgi:hypothetical protein
MPLKAVYEANQNLSTLVGYTFLCAKILSLIIELVRGRHKLHL